MRTIQVVSLARLTFYYSLLPDCTISSRGDVATCYHYFRAVRANSPIATSATTALESVAIGARDLHILDANSYVDGHDFGVPHDCSARDCDRMKAFECSKVGLNFSISLNCDSSFMGRFVVLPSHGGHVAQQ